MSPIERLSEHQLAEIAEYREGRGNPDLIVASKIQSQLQKVVIERIKKSEYFYKSPPRGNTLMTYLVISRLNPGGVMGGKGKIELEHLLPVVTTNNNNAFTIDPQGFIYPISLEGVKIRDLKEYSTGVFIPQLYLEYGTGPITLQLWSQPTEKDYGGKDTSSIRQGATFPLSEILMGWTGNETVSLTIGNKIEIIKTKRGGIMIDSLTPSPPSVGGDRYLDKFRQLYPGIL